LIAELGEVQKALQEKNAVAEAAKSDLKPLEDELNAAEAKITEAQKMLDEANAKRNGLLGKPNVDAQLDEVTKRVGVLYSELVAQKTKLAEATKAWAVIRSNQR